MSNSDKMRQKLMNTMRKTKEGSDSNMEDQKPVTEGVATETKKPVKKTPSPKKTTAKTKKEKSNPFQSGQRVWPD